MLSFQQFIVESPVIAGDYSLESKFDHYNSLLFDNRIPRCPVTWALLKGVGGRTMYTTTGRAIIPGSLSIEINTKFKRTEQGLDAILIHEMIHAHLAVINGDGDGKHGFRFQSQAHRLSEIVGFQIPLKDQIDNLELTQDEKPMTTVVFYKKSNEWLANFYSGTAFDTPEKMDALVAFWGAPDKLREGQEIMVVKVETNLGAKYGMSRTLKQNGWYKLPPMEYEAVMRGHVIKTILPNSVSHEDAVAKMPSKETLVVLQTNKLRGTVYGTFLFPNIVKDPIKMARLITKWKGYYTPGMRDIEIFTTYTTIFNRGMSMKKDETSGMYYNLNPEAVAELHRNAKYIEKWA